MGREIILGLQQLDLLRNVSMPYRRLEVIIHGRRQRAAAVRLLSSAHAPWSGFLLERHEVSAGYARSMFWPRHRVVLVAVGTVNIEDRAL